MRLLCVDEVHCLSQWSHNFRTSYLRLEEIIHDKIKPICVLGLTATATQPTVKSIVDALRVPSDGLVTARLLRTNLILSVSQPQERRGALVKMFKTTYAKYWDAQKQLNGSLG